MPMDFPQKPERCVLATLLKLLVVLVLKDKAAFA